MEEEDVVETGGCVARAERRVGEGIAAPKPILVDYQHLVCAGDLAVVLVVSASREEAASAGMVVWRRVVERSSASSDGWRKRGFGGLK